MSGRLSQFKLVKLNLNAPKDITALYLIIFTMFQYETLTTEKNMKKICHAMNFIYLRFDSKRK